MRRDAEPITEGDAEQLLNLFESAGPFVSARTLSDYWLYARLFSSTCLCIRDEHGRPIAAVVAFCDQSPGRNEIYVQDVAVSSTHRKQGLGHELLDALHRRARQWGTERIWLTSEAENTAAMKLWHKLGYTNAPADYQQDGLWISRDLKGPGRDRAVFELRLSQDSTERGLGR